MPCFLDIHRYVAVLVLIGLIVIAQKWVLGKLLPLRIFLAKPLIMARARFSSDVCCAVFWYVQLLKVICIGIDGPPIHRWGLRPFSSFCIHTKDHVAPKFSSAPSVSSLVNYREKTGRPWYFGFSLKAFLCSILSKIPWPRTTDLRTADGLIFNSLATDAQLISNWLTARWQKAALASTISVLSVATRSAFHAPDFHFKRGWRLGCYSSLLIIGCGAWNAPYVDTGRTNPSAETYHTTARHL